MKEIIAWTHKGFSNRCHSEISGENGIFGYAVASLTYGIEAPAVRTASDTIPLEQVRIATDAQQEHYLALVAEIEKLRESLRQTEIDIVANGTPMTWEWILQHEKPREGKWPVPIPYQSKKTLANLRKGSRVVITAQSSAYAGIAGKVGKIVKKRSKDVIVRIGQHQYRVWYPDLQSAEEVTEEKRKDVAKHAEMLGRVANQFSKIIP